VIAGDGEPEEAGESLLAGVCARVMAYDGQGMADLPAGELSALVEDLTTLRSLVEHWT
jgi:hypothetical protein